MKSIFDVRYFFYLATLSSVLSISCNKSNPLNSAIPSAELILISETTLPFTEPSGIAYSETLQRLWIVSGGDQNIYMLDTNGNVEKKLRFVGIDLEGIAFDQNDSTLWTIDESTKEISHLDHEGNVLLQKQLTYSSKPNKGPEGITIGKGHTLYILNQRDPCVLYELDTAYQIARSYQLNFAPDVSDISYDSINDSFFILSGASEALFVWNKEQGVTMKYTLPNIANEGIAFDQTRKVFYIVNDSTAQLSLFRKR